MDTVKEAQILELVEKLTNSGTKVLDDDLMKKLKGICKTSDLLVSYAYYALMTQLRKEHSEIRYSTLLVINEFLCRSSAFRKLLEPDLEEFMELVAETNPEYPLPLPKNRAKELKLKGLEFMQAWSNKFGEKYIRFQMALTYLKKCRKIDFNDMEARSVAQREKERQERERQERMINEKINKIKSEMPEISDEVSNVLLQMENCFRLLVPHPNEELFSMEDFNEADDSNTHKNSVNCDNVDLPLNKSNENISGSLRQHGIYDMKKSITVEVCKDAGVSVKASEDTLPIIENLNDLHKQMSSRFLPVVTNWLKTLSKGSNCTDTLKKAIDLKNSMETAFEKYKELKINTELPKCDSEEDDDFEEVTEKEGFETEAFQEKRINLPSSQPGCSKDVPMVDKAYLWKLKHSADDATDPTSAASTLSKRWSKMKGLIPPSSSFVSEQKEQSASQKSKLLEKAPVLPYDIDLYHWEEEKIIIPERVRFDSLHKFWETKDDAEDNEVLNEVQRASLRTRKIDFSGKFEPVKWACRAPLASGKLCPRKDRYKCPFHGKIVQRDASGNPVDAGEAAGPSTSASTAPDVPEWQDPELLKDIEAATGIDLKMPQKRGKGKKSSSKKDAGLTNIKKIKSTARDRLSKKIMKRYKHYAHDLDEMERKKFNDKFGDQWNYY